MPERAGYGAQASERPDGTRAEAAEDGPGPRPPRPLRLSGVTRDLLPSEGTTSSPGYANRRGVKYTGGCRSLQNDFYLKVKARLWP